MVMADTHYTVSRDVTVKGPDGTPYQYRAGDQVPMVEAERMGLAGGKAASAAEPAAGAEMPKWYQAKAEKAAAEGTAIPALNPGETQKEYEERVAAGGQPGPSQNAQGSGPSEKA
jgi:hypothetical protein